MTDPSNETTEPFYVFWSYHVTVIMTCKALRDVSEVLLRLLFLAQRNIFQVKLALGHRREDSLCWKHTSPCLMHLCFPSFCTNQQTATDSTEVYMTRFSSFGVTIFWNVIFSHCYCRFTAECFNYLFFRHLYIQYLYIHFLRWCI